MDIDQIRVLPEPPAPVDDQGELLLDPELAGLAAELTEQAAQLARLAGAAKAPAGRRRWGGVAFRLVPLAAAALWVCVVARVPQPPAASRPAAQPAAPVAPSLDVWRLDQVSSPELEGALDLLPADTTLRISI
jgi:hypothetical protein